MHEQAEPVVVVVVVVVLPQVSAEPELARTIVEEIASDEAESSESSRIGGVSMRTVVVDARTAERVSAAFAGQVLESLRELGASRIAVIGALGRSWDAFMLAVAKDPRLADMVAADRLVLLDDADDLIEDSPDEGFLDASQFEQFMQCEIQYDDLLEVEDEGPRPVRLDVLLNQETADAISALSERLQVPLNEVLRRAVATYAFMDERRIAGDRFLIEGAATGSTEELVLL